MTLAGGRFRALRGTFVVDFDETKNPPTPRPPTPGYRPTDIFASVFNEIHATWVEALISVTIPQPGRPLAALNSRGDHPTSGGPTTPSLSIHSEPLPAIRDRGRHYGRKKANCFVCRNFHPDRTKSAGGGSAFKE